jgi:hypothetical protein
MSKILEITTGFLGEEYTLKNALTRYKAEKEGYYREQRLTHPGGFIPNQHLIIADIKNCKSMLKKL